MTVDRLDEAARLIQKQRTMVLATADPDPWSAPVYFVYSKKRFYFFSSPKSRHVVAAVEPRRCAAAIFRDGDNWRDIEGLQMEGQVERVQLGVESLRVFSKYVKKFPTVKDFFTDSTCEFGQFIDRFRTQLYAFVPEHAFYLNNAAGLNKRQEIELPV